jgi:aryl-alcohol dehydrogenase-like predicted oxidoreductase
MLNSHAEVYGFGKSEKYLGDFQRKTNTSVKIATKFAPLPWRFTSDAPVKALKVTTLTLLLHRGN